MLAWINSEPIDSKTGKILEKRVYNGQLPDKGMFEYLVDCLFYLGIAGHSPSGLIPISWYEINSWLSISKIKLELWELEIIRELSSIYVQQYYKSKDINCIQPWTPEIMDQEKFQENIKSFLRMFSGKK